MNETLNSTDLSSRVDELSAYLEGDLNPGRAAELERELESNDALRDELTALRSLRLTLRELPDPEVPFGLSTRVMARVRDGEANPGWFQSMRSWFGGSGFSSLGTAACGFAAAAFLFGTDAGQGLLGNTGPGLTGAPSQLLDSAEAPPRLKQGFIPEVDRIDTVSRPGSGSLTRAPRIADPATTARPPQSAPPLRAERAASDTAQREVFAVVRPPEPVAEVERVDAQAAATVETRDRLDFRSCLVANPVGDPACDKTYQHWVDLAQNNRTAFQREMETVPGPVRDVWLQQLASFARRSGQVFAVAPAPRVETGPGRSFPPPSALGFGPNSR